MPRLPMMRVIGSHDISVSLRPGFAIASAISVSDPQGLQRGSYPVCSTSEGLRHFGSRLTVPLVIARNLRISIPYGLLSAEETDPPGGSSMKGMNLSGKPGMVQPM